MTAASPAMPAFSYAQAAKGLAPTKDKEESVEQSPKPASKPDSNPSQPPSRSSRSRARADDKETTVTPKETPTPSSTAEDPVEKENVPPTRPSQQRSEATTSSATSPNLAGSMASLKDKDLTTQQLDRSDSWDKASHTSAGADKESSNVPKDKVKESEDDWEKVSVPSVSGDKDKELRPAPPPPVNFWTARKEANEAKVRELVGLRTAATSQSAPPSATVAKSQSFTEGPKHKQGPRDSANKEKMSASRQSIESGRGNERSDLSSSQTLRAGARHGDKADAATVPAVGDVTSWPTPETAIEDDRRKSSTQEKTDARSNSSKQPGKQWVTMPFVPTAKFETQLPPAAARRGARSGRGRDGMTRAAHNANTAAAAAAGDKQDAAGAMAPPPVPRSDDRGRKSDGSRGGRSSSLPTGNRRPSSRESTMAIARKPAGQGRDNTGVPAATQAPPAPETDQARNQRTSNFTSHTPSRSSSHHEGPGMGNEPTTNGDFNVSKVVAEPIADPFTGPATEANPRSTYLPDRSKPAHSSYRPGGDAARESRAPRNRDWSREKSDAAREKVESWRERSDYNGDPSYRRDNRPDRGRGGFRGRGGHPPSYQNAHAYTSPLPQNGFENPKVSGPPESRSRQSSQPFVMGPPPPGSASRNNPRSQSIPVGMVYPGYYHNAAGMMSPIQNDMSAAYGYPPQMSMQPGMMPGMPYNDPLNSYAVLSMVMTQIEYYFSIDNLCKDLYLRKNMDSQGYVPLTIIANFKRIKTLTDETMSIDTLRFVCQQVKSVEYLHGENGEDRLRRRDGWEDFVLEKQERFTSAQNDGPSHQPQPQHQGQQMSMMQSMPLGAGAPFVPQQMRSPQATMPAMNGEYHTSPAAEYAPVPNLDGQAGDQSHQMPYSRLTQDQHRRESATSPISQAESGQRQPMPFSPSQRPAGGMVNGHRRQVSRNFNEENVFPDDAIASINICVREPLPESVSEDQSPMPGMNRVLSNESRGSNADVPPVSIAPHVSGLRGGAASPEQLSRLQGMKFGFSNAQAAAMDNPAFYTKEGEQTQMPPVKPGQYFVSYNALHDSSLQQREQGVEGAMKPMYSFWANFLVDKFNEGMYKEFKTLADSDLQDGDAVGNQHLMNYYVHALKSSAALSERVATDLVTQLREEKSDSSRWVFKMMRIAWRDGALNLKTRKRIGDLLQDDEKVEFDKGG